MIDLKKFKFNELPKKEIPFSGDTIQIRALTSREMLKLGEMNDENSIEMMLFVLKCGCDIDQNIAEKLIDTDITDATNIVTEIINLSNEFHGSISDILEKKI